MQLLAVGLNHHTAPVATQGLFRASHTPWRPIPRNNPSHENLTREPQICAEDDRIVTHAYAGGGWSTRRGVNP